LSTITSPSVEMQYMISGNSLTDAITITPPSGFNISLTSGTGFVSSPNTLTIDHVSGEVPPTTIYVRMQSSQTGPMQGAILHESVGASPVEVNVEGRSEEHTSELQSRENLVCRLLLEKKK